MASPVLLLCEMERGRRVVVVWYRNRNIPPNEGSPFPALVKLRQLCCCLRPSSPCRNKLASGSQREMKGRVIIDLWDQPQSTDAGLPQQAAALPGLPSRGGQSEWLAVTAVWSEGFCFSLILASLYLCCFQFKMAFPCPGAFLNPNTNNSF